jgi:hypothetical protein
MLKIVSCDFLPTRCGFVPRANLLLPQASERAAHLLSCCEVSGDVTTRRVSKGAMRGPSLTRRVMKSTARGPRSCLSLVILFNPCQSRNGQPDLRVIE